MPAADVRRRLSIPSRITTTRRVLRSPRANRMEKEVASSTMAIGRQRNAPFEALLRISYHVEGETELTSTNQTKGLERPVPCC